MQLFVKTLLLSLGLATTLSACTSDGGQVKAKSIGTSQWTLEQIDGEALTLGAGQKAPWLIVDEQMQAKGYAGCNNFFGEAKIQGNEFSLPKMGSTMKLCNTTQNRLDNKLRQVLSGWSTISINNDTMMLSNRDHSLTFKTVQQ